MPPTSQNQFMNQPLRIERNEGLHTRGAPAQYGNNNQLGGMFSSPAFNGIRSTPTYSEYLGSSATYSTYCYLCFWGFFLSAYLTVSSSGVSYLWNHHQSANIPLLRFFSGGGGPTVSAGAKASLNKIFDKYREDATTEPDVIGVEGTMAYLGDIDVNIEGLDALAVLEIVQAPAMGETAREGFVDGWSALGYILLILM